MLRFWPLSLALAALPTLAIVGDAHGRQPHPAAELGSGDLMEFRAPKSVGPTALVRTEGAALSSGSHLGHGVLPAISATAKKHVEHHRTDSIAVLPNGHALVVHEANVKGHNKTVGGHDSVALVVKAMAPNMSNIATNKNVTEAVGTPTQPNHLYFGIGIGMFLFALLVMAVGMKKMNYLDEMGVLTEEQASSSQANPQGEEDEPSQPASRRSSTNPMHPGNSLPFRMQQVLISWVFIVASVAYFLDFLALQAGYTSARHWFGVVASLLWCVGFLVSLHWQVSVGSNAVQLISSAFKVLACVMGQVHPFSMIMGCNETDPGVWWPAVAGIASWHIGNIIGAMDNYANPPEGTRPTLGWMAHGNLPLLEMWVDMGATWLLLYAMGAITMWWGHPEKQLVATNDISVVFTEFGGATCFLLAACIRCEWCNGFRNCSHREPRETQIPEQQS